MSSTGTRARNDLFLRSFQRHGAAVRRRIGCWRSPSCRARRSKPDCPHRGLSLRSKLGEESELDPARRCEKKSPFSLELAMCSWRKGRTSPISAEEFHLRVGQLSSGRSKGSSEAGRGSHTLATTIGSVTSPGAVSAVRPSGRWPSQAETSRRRRGALKGPGPESFL